MPLRCLAALLLTLAPLAAQAGDIVIEDSYARAATPIARSGAAYMVIRNTGSEDDRLIGVNTPMAEVAQLHTHVMEGGGVMRMRPAPDGFAVPAGGTALLERGGDHVMLMGLTEAMQDGSSFEMTLTFEHAGQMTIEVPVDMKRMPDG
ncbi:copper chaperone PCu(A)C [Pseudooceanicola sp. 216_PA32_1]|jgi:periplasmic copper chaperone A|uniref:Copper chaperone PCu(A)C n=1 Tax=Pseudooceanicola pacificus TaxID=2676438 RepID=A0A844W1T6_9RHOB|nr:copper chaperone PCu(A)C [Pseudooceanicola pacificus]MWB77717.1 copper chaperone PCu(A)C [Pseudooceanicola pacificus]